MPAERYYYPHLLQEEQNIILEDTEFHHLVNVMRNRVDDIIEIVNGQGQLAEARLMQVEKKRAHLKIEGIVQAPQLEQPLILVQAIPRLSKLETILEKCTELGMTEVWLFPAAHTEKKQFSENQFERLHTILISAMKQCGRLFLPKLILMPPLKQWPKFSISAYYGDIHPEAPSFASVWSPNKGSIFCVGPESGFTIEETVILKNLGATGVKLNKNILRTETAAIAAVSLISHWQQEL